MSSASTHPAPSPAHNSALLRTPLHALHLEYGAKMAEFANYDMPIQYSMGIIKEHLHTRAAAGLFDVSHMGQIKVTALSGRPQDAALALESVVPADILGLAVGRQVYSQFTTPNGGISDDLMIANYGDYFLLIVNAAGKIADFAMLQGAIGDRCRLEHLTDRALIALQGPMAEQVLAKTAPDAAQMRFMEVRVLTILGNQAMVSRSGYTGEDGYEISLPLAATEAVTRHFLTDPRVNLIGLGARDSLRLEAGLCLYGSDIDLSTTPIEAGLTWSIPKIRRLGGARAGGFPGDRIILPQITEGVAKRRIGLRPLDRAPIRGGTPLYATEQGGDGIGIVTSGGFSPSLNAPIAMAYVTAAHLAALGDNQPIFAELRGRFVAVATAPMPFVPNRYKK